MFICQNSEGVHPYLLKCCRGTCSFVGMLNGYMVRKRLGTPVLEHGFPTFLLSCTPSAFRQMNMYPFSISTVEHVSLTFLMTKYFTIIHRYI